MVRPLFVNCDQQKGKNKQNKFDLWTLINDDSWTTRKKPLKDWTSLGKVLETYQSTNDAKWTLCVTISPKGQYITRFENIYICLFGI